MKISKKVLEKIIQEEIKNLNEGPIQDLITRAKARTAGELSAATAGPTAKIFKGLRAILKKDPGEAAAVAKLDPDKRRAKERIESLLKSFYDQVSGAHRSFSENYKKLGLESEDKFEGKLSPLLSSMKATFDAWNAAYLKELAGAMDAMGLQKPLPRQDQDLTTVDAGTSMDIGVPEMPVGEKPAATTSVEEPAKESPTGAPTRRIATRDRLQKSRQAVADLEREMGAKRDKSGRLSF